MIDKTEPTTAAIKEYLEQEHDCFPWCVHEKAVILLKRLEAAEANIKAVRELAEGWCNYRGDYADDELTEYGKIRVEVYESLADELLELLEQDIEGTEQ